MRREEHTGFWSEDLREGDPLQDQGVDGKITLKCIFKMWDGCTDWMALYQDMGRWRALVNSVMNLRVP